mmetsp:Transcript_21228/g.36231  ORF Transcript_21228/g.36231 Transcript_21228/m.36231 type:complete len:169 (+) Transcript_21228:326-832(+)
MDWRILRYSNICRFTTGWVVGLCLVRDGIHRRTWLPNQGADHCGRISSDGGWYYPDEGCAPHDGEPKTYHGRGLFVRYAQYIPHRRQDSGQGLVPQFAAKSTLSSSLRHTQHRYAFVEDLKVSVEETRKEGATAKTLGMAAVYGAVTKLPTGPADELLKAFTDITLTP